MTSLVDFYLAAPADVAPVEGFEISHPNMTQTYRFTPQVADGVTAGGLDFVYYPAVVQPAGENDDLDHDFSIQLGDLGDLMPGEIDAIEAADGMLTKPTVRYWLYRSDDLDTPMLGPVVLEAAQFTITADGSGIDARAPRLNLNRTGEIYTIERFPMLRGFI